MPTSPPIIPSPPPRSVDGNLLPAVPFQFKASPTVLRVPADQHTGTFSGEFEIGLQIIPGPIQNYGSEILEVITLRADGDGVQYFPNTPVITPLLPIRLEFNVDYFDLPTPYIYDLTLVISVINESPVDQTILLGILLEPLEGSVQSTLTLEKSNVVVKSGAIETVLLAIESVAQNVGREMITVSPLVISSAQNTIPLKIVLNFDPQANIPNFYQVITSSPISVQINNPVNILFGSANGPVGAETWEVNDLSFLIDHGMRFSPNGQLTASQVKGPPTQRKLVFRSMTQTGPRSRVYAAKAITLLIIN